MNTITLESGQFGWDYLVVNDETGESILIQTDWDYPGIASTFGFIPCECGETDGTVDCPHKSATEMINEARDYLNSCIGESVDDPGYF